MRYMLMHKLDEDVPGNFDPSPEFIKTMGAFMEEVVQAGVLLAAEGLCSSKQEAARITVEKGKTTVTDGPFTETKELIAGFALVDVRSREEAVEWGKRFTDVFVQHGIDVEVDVRRVHEQP
ncbi:YciI family protein [Micromonospora sp. DT47]|uniref:YciI family protein n=1 Tax=Micromonospora sp. DT47 TaxID=3393431 RepID=UPI003CF21F74